MDQQARLGFLLCPGVQQETLSENLVALQRRQSQSSAFRIFAAGKELLGSLWEEYTSPSTAAGAADTNSILQLTFSPLPTGSCLSQLQATSSFSPLPLPLPQVGSNLSRSPQAPRRAALWAPGGSAAAVGLEEEAGLLQLMSPPAGHPDLCCISSLSPPPLPLLLLLLLL